MSDRSFNIGFIICVILLIGGGIFFIKGVQHSANQFTDEKSGMSAKMGKRIVVGRDTLTIVDYSMIMQNYKLSNGVKVDKSFVDSGNVIK